MTSGPVTAKDAVRRLSLALGEEHALIGPLAGGETGATAIDGPDGSRRVLKWERDLDNQERRREGLLLAERLRTEAGWPVPRQRCVDHEGCLFVVQDFMDGEAVTRLTHGFVDEVFDLHDRRLGLARPQDADRWGADMIEVLVHGGNGYCRHEPPGSTPSLSHDATPTWPTSCSGSSTGPSARAGRKRSSSGWPGLTSCSPPDRSRSRGSTRLQGSGSLVTWEG